VVGQLLPRLSRACGVRRLQAVRYRPGEPQDDARPLPADQEPDGVVLPEGAGFLLIKRLLMTPRVVVTPTAAKLRGELADRHGAVMFHQSGGCCDGSSPMCYPDGDFIVGDRDVLLGFVEHSPVWISG